MSECTRIDPKHIASAVYVGIEGQVRKKLEAFVLETCQDLIVSSVKNIMDNIRTTAQENPSRGIGAIDVGVFVESNLLRYEIPEVLYSSKREGKKK